MNSHLHSAKGKAQSFSDLFVLIARVAHHKRRAELVRQVAHGLYNILHNQRSFSVITRSIRGIIDVVLAIGIIRKYSRLHSTTIFIDENIFHNRIKPTLEIRSLLELLAIGK